MTGHSGKSRTALALVLILGLGACDGGGEMSGGLFGPRQDRAEADQALPPPQPDSRGVITYASYQVMVAQQGDTVASMASRVGLTPQELARHNGLPPTYSPRAGEVLALPRNVGGTPVNASIWSADIAASAIDQAGTSGGQPLPQQQQQQRVVTSSVDNPFNNGQDAPVIDPVRHRVEAGETAFSIARRYGVSVTALASWNGLDNDMTLRKNQELLIPVVDGTGRPRQAAAAAAPAAPAANAPGTPSAVTPPPSAAAPLPRNQDVRETTPPASPNLAADRSPPPSTPMAMPVAGGSVLRGYEPGGANGNEGVDFAVAAGTEVKAADAGTVALISESRGGLGTIVLVRHPDNLMTVYGRITGVTLEKGDTVSRGQKIGVVADGNPANLHFEVRRGTASVDPAPFLGL